MLLSGLLNKFLSIYCACECRLFSHYYCKNPIAGGVVTDREVLFIYFHFLGTIYKTWFHLFIYTLDIL